jgi:hypothetical protein
VVMEWICDMKSLLESKEHGILGAM